MNMNEKQFKDKNIIKGLSQNAIYHVQKQPTVVPTYILVKSSSFI